MVWELLYWGLIGEAPMERLRIEIEIEIEDVILGFGLCVWSKVEWLMVGDNQSF